MATLSGNKIKDTYQSLIKLTDNGNLTTGAKQLTDGFGNNSPLYISTTQIGIGVTPEATYDLHVYSNAKVGGNLTVTGDLTVEGTTTTIDTQTLTVEDPLIEVASNNTSTDAVDIGWYGKYAPSGTVLYAGLFRDTGDSKFKLFRNLEEQPTTTVNTGGTGYTVATLVANLEGNVTGDITGNADTATALETARTIQVSGDIAGSASFDGTADINISTTIQPNSVALGTDTTGNYVATISGTANEITVSDSGSESAAVTISLPSSISVDVTGDLTGDVYNADGSIILNTGDNSIDAVLSNGVRATTQTQGDNSTKLATTAYVDSAIGGQDTLAEILANGNTTGGTDIDVSVGDSINFAGSGSTSTVIEHDIYDTRIINDNSLGGIILRSAITVMQNAAGTETSAFFREDGAVELYYDNSKKFATTSTGVSVTGDVSIPVSNKLFFGGGNHTYISEDVDDNLTFFVGGAEFMSFAEGVSDTIRFYKDAIFYGDVIVPEYIKHEGDADTSIRFTNNYIRFYTANNEVLELQSDGQVNVISSGTATNPCIIIGDDLNTGIWRPALDTFAISTGGSEKMRIDSSGNIGVGVVPESWGTNGDVRAIQISTMTSLSEGFDGTQLASNFYFNGTNDKYIQSDFATSYLQIYGTHRWRYAASGTADANITWSEAMRIDSSGRVGIGTDSPSTVLDVRNSINIGGAGQDSNIYFQQNTSNQARINYYTDNSMIFDNWNGGYYFRTTSSFTPRVTILNGGNVGIGTTSPSHALDVTSGAYDQVQWTRTSGVSGYLYSDSAGAGIYSGASFSQAGIYLVPNTSMDFRVNGSQRMYINSSGNVGINVTSPNAGLQTALGGTSIPSAGSNTGSVCFGNTTSGSAYGLVMGANSSGVGYISSQRTDGTATTYNLAIQPNGGNVGIGTTSPSRKLEVAGDLRVDGLSSGTSVSFGGTGDFAIDAPGVGGGRFIVKHSSGNVGIGTASPAYGLDVQNSNAAQFYHGVTTEATANIRCRHEGAETSSDRATQISFRDDGDNEVGSIKSSGSATFYNTSSDYRLKQNEKDFNGLDLVDNIKVYDFEWKKDGGKDYGVFAHELQEIVPEAVSGEKDGEEMQGVDYSKLVPILLKSIQELKQEIEILKSK